jgi:hypothetical protein
MPAIDHNAPTPERRRRSAFLVGPAIGTESEAARAGSRVYRSLTTLERLARDGAISPRQAEAGERLRTDYELGIAGARDAAGNSPAIGWYYAEARLAAIRSFQAASNALGPLCRYVVPIAVGNPGMGECSISTLARSLSANRQEIAGIVKLGLNTLADHYGLG